MTAGMEIYTINVCAKDVKVSFGFIRHYFIQIPHMELEIHPGQYKYGTHHVLGFTRRYDELWTMEICESCLDQLVNESMRLFQLWYYPVINCETLTRGLVSGVPVSFQTLIYCSLLFSSIAILWNFNFAFVSICLIILLFLFNNYFRIQDGQQCLHINEKYSKFATKEPKINENHHSDYTAESERSQARYVINS